jgi:alkylated DNA repair dioxygenase AlkB
MSERMMDRDTATPPTPCGWNLKEDRKHDKKARALAITVTKRIHAAFAGAGDDRGNGDAVLFDASSQHTPTSRHRAECDSHACEVKISRIQCILLNCGEQAGVDPNELRDAVATCIAADDDVSVDSITTAADLCFARVALTVHSAGADRDSHAGVALIVQRLAAWRAVSGAASSLPSRMYVRVLSPNVTTATHSSLFAPYRRVWVPIKDAQDDAPSQSAQVPGLHVVHDFITELQEASLLGHLGADQPAAGLAPWWETVNGRLVTHHGRRFVYGENTWSADAPALPPLLTLALRNLEASARFRVNQLTCTPFAELDQCTINWYPVAGVGIPPHTDDTVHFGPLIVVVSLVSDVVITWWPPQHSAAEPIDVVVPRRSLLWFSGPARHEWKHSIAERRRDAVMTDPAGRNGFTLQRQPRVSITYRSTV